MKQRIGTPAYVKSSASAIGTSLRGYVTCSFNDLRKIFGKPEGETDEYKVSTRWILQNTDTGDVVTVYDYAMTNLYDKNLPGVERLRAMEKVEWHIGAHSEAIGDAFILWLQEELRP